ncbi:hypothetical protein B0H17DRAFT_982724 [Mycena rosella]|uniref:FAD-binding PCMH-type domain-containing protein n=1 Tax=Mycena rosella TaxID=1033263 RepID=A0AAD7DH30_MYCRO|nr:hypothetical protein B0H17DRAFT_982724 [Mycena rosella]
MQLRSLVRLLAFAPHFARSSAKLTCKCLAGAACFPDASTLNAFSANLSHPLITGQRPPASVCYPDDPDYDTSACSIAVANDGNPTYLASKINALQYTNFQALINSTTVEDCPYDVQPGATCFQGRVPPYAVNATTVSDVQATLRFASQHNLRLVVRNSGHELMGRAFGVGALELFMHNFDTMQFSDNFIPVGAPKNTPGQYAVALGAGVQWGEVFASADQHNRSIAGGLAPGGTVGAAGGWTLGAGHSVLSPFYGLGVDNALQFFVVLPNSSFIIANKYQNTDIFWALRGGGGPSFGVVVSTTVRTHPNLPYTVAFYTATGNSSSAYTQLLEVWMQQHNAISDAGWSGVWPFLNNTLYLTFFTQGVPPTSHTANATMEHFFAASKKIPGVDVSLAISHPYPSFQAWNEDNLVDSSKGFGFNFSALAPGAPRMAYSSWLMPRQLTTPTNAKTLAKIISNITVGLPFFVGGGAVSKVDPDDSAVTPAWRTTISDMNIVPSFAAGPDVDIRDVQKTAFDQIDPIRKLAPPPTGGQYLNEPDILEVDWQQAYWGRHYPRLLAIKKTIDPLDLLIVRKGVNSEDWDDEITCKTA